MVSKYGGVGNTLDVPGGGGGGSGWPPRNNRRGRPTAVRIALFVGFVVIAVFLMVMAMGPYGSDTTPINSVGGGVAGIATQKVGAVRRALGEKKLKGDTLGTVGGAVNQNKNGGGGGKLEVKQSDEELSAAEKKEVDAYFRSVTCKNDHVIYTPTEALRASTTSQIPKDKLSAMTPLKVDDTVNTDADGAANQQPSPRIIIIIYGWVLDVTSFLQFHPGGKMLLEGVGKQDSAGIFMQHHGPSTATLLQGFCIGVVKG